MQNSHFSTGVVLEKNLFLFEIVKFKPSTDYHIL